MRRKMAVSTRLCLCLLACYAVSLTPVSAKPAGGIAKFPDIFLPVSTDKSAQVNNIIKVGVCKEIGLYDGSKIEVTGFHKAVAAEGSADHDLNVPFQIRVKLFKATCANTVGDQLQEKSCDTDLGDTTRTLLGLEFMAEYVSLVMNATSVNHKFSIGDSWTSNFAHPLPPPSSANGNKTVTTTTQPAKATTTTKAENKKITTTPPKPANGKDESGSKTAQKRSVFRREAKQPSETTAPPETQNFIPVQNGSAMYIVQVLITRNLTLQSDKEDGSLNVSVTLKMRNPHGYLSAVDYPALVFYGVMTAVYTIYAFAWIVMMACSYKDLVRLQFWVLAVILLGFLEKMLFVSEYGSVNTGHDPSGLIMIAELVSAVKRALSRMLLIIVAMGFGTVKPRLGDSLGKVVAIGVVYTILAVMDGIIRARNETFVSRDAASTVTLALLLIFDTLVMYWIFTAIVDTRRTLRLRKNYVKLSMYNHFAYTLIFAIVASLGFVVWALVTLNFPSGGCLTDWREVWLRECFWHVLFAFILLIVMIIWRPSANRNRFAYSLVNDDEDIEDEEPEQGPNKNFDTVKMRQMTKSESEAPPTVSFQAEDDLRWVEENLPTTAMDRALPLILDSDEEVMTTKFEISKMN